MVKVNYDIRVSENRIELIYAELLAEMGSHLELMEQNKLTVTTFRAQMFKLKRMKKNVTGIIEKDLKYKQDQRKYEIPGEIKELVKEASERLKINLYPAARAGVLNEKGLKYGIIKKLYLEKAKNGEKYKDIQDELGEQYGISAGSIRRHMNERVKNES